MKKDKYTNRTAIILVLLIIFFSFLLYRDLTRTGQAGKEKKIGILLGKTNYIYRKYNSEVVWGEIQKNSVINNKDTIRSLESSDAEILLYDGTRLILEKNSMIYLDFSDKNIKIDFRSGKLKIKRPQNLKTKTDLGVDMKGDTTGISKDSEVLLSLENGRRQGNVQVKKGTAIFQSNGKEEKIQQNEELLVDGKNFIRLKAKFQLDFPEEKNYILEENSGIEFRWQSLTDIKEVNLEVARDYFFRKKIVSKKISQQKLNQKINQKIKPGTYYWRLSFRDKTGQKKNTEARKFSFLYKTPIKIISPSPDSIFFYLDKAPPISIAWQESNLASSYRLDIYSDSQLQNKVYHSDLITNRVLVDNLTEGKYYFQIKLITNNKEVAGIQSKIQSFSINKSKKMIPPQIISGQNGYTYSKRKLRLGNSILSWTSDMNYTVYDVEISSDKDFQNKIMDKKVTKNFVTIPKKLQEGTFYWRVRGISGKKSSEFAGSTLKILKKVPIKILKPKAKAVFIVGNFNEIQFLWTRPYLSGKYTLEISNDNFSSIQQKRTTASNSVDLKLAEGKYQYRIVHLANDGSRSLSNTQNIIIMDKPRAPVLEYPIANQVVNLTEKNSVEFFWQKVKQAKSYTFRLIHRSSGKVILEKQLNDNQYKLKNLKLLDETGYIWEVAAGYGKNSGQGKISRANFSITLNDPDEIPQLLNPDEQLIE